MTPSDDSATRDSGPELRWFRTWRGVYLAVLACFVADVLMLAAFEWFFS
jgi:hypothetical protein